MKEKLIEILKLKPDAGDDEVVAAVADLYKSTPGATDPKVKAKMAAGLSLEQSLEVVANQDREDGKNKKSKK